MILNQYSPISMNGLESGPRYSLDLVCSHLKQPPNFKFKDELFGAGISFDGFSSLVKAWLSQVFFFMDNTKHRGKRGRYGKLHGLQNHYFILIGYRYH